MIPTWIHDHAHTRRTLFTHARKGGSPLKRSSTGETVATYLNKRLAQIGVGHVFTIPGDYIEEWVGTLDDPEQNAGLVRVHPNNEVSATYAADGYGRAVPGTVGCVAFTYGVGALNAVQAVAGAYVERVPMVVINGSPSTAQYHSERDQGTLYHHMLDGSRTDERILREVTEIGVRIDNPATAPDLIDAALRTCLTTSRPVYIEIAALVAGQSCCPVPDAPITAAPAPQSPQSLQEATQAVIQHMRRARRLVLFGGVELARYGLQERFARLVELSQAPFVSSALGKSFLSESHPSYAGVYMGRSSQDNVQELMTEADCVVALGVLDTDFNYLGVVTPDYDPDAATKLPGPTHIQARGGAVLVGKGLAYWGDVRLDELLDALIATLEGHRALPHAPFPGLEGSPWDIPPTSDFDPDGGITWDSFKSHLAHGFLGRYDEQEQPVLVADSGFSFVAMTNVKVPRGGFIAQLAWAAIGYGVGATYGAGLAQRVANTGRRTVTVTGDAAFAETIQALGTAAQLGLGGVFFVMDNRVYAVEQWLIDPAAFAGDAPPPDFAPLCAIPQGHIWDYVKIAEGFGGRGFAVSTNAELADVMDQLRDDPIHPVTGQPTFTLVAVRIPAKDLPDNTRWKVPTS